MIRHLRQTVRRFPAVFAGCLLAVLFCAVGLFDVWRWAEQPVSDRLQAQRQKIPPAPRNLFLVDVDNSTLDTHGDGAWPLSRLAYATALQALQNRSVRAVGIEVPLTESNPALEAFDAAVARQAARLPAVVLAAAALQRGGETNAPPALPGLPAGAVQLDRLVDHQGLLLPVPALLGDARVGLNNLPRGPDEPVRSVPLAFRFGERLLPSFLLQCILAFEGLSPSDAAFENRGELVVRRGGEVVHRIPVDAGLRMALPARPFRPELDRIGLDALVLAAQGRDAGLRSDDKPPFDMDGVRERFVLIGRQAPETQEPLPTVLGARPPAEVIALAWQTVFARPSIRPLSPWLLCLAFAPLAVFLVWFSARFGMPWPLLIAAFAVADLWFLSVWILSEFRLWIFAVPPGAMCVAAVALGIWLRRASHPPPFAPPSSSGIARAHDRPRGWSGPP